MDVSGGYVGNSSKEVILLLPGGEDQPKLRGARIPTLIQQEHRAPPTSMGVNRGQMDSQDLNLHLSILRLGLPTPTTAVSNKAS